MGTQEEGVEGEEVLMEEEGEPEAIIAERFDFTMMETFYAHGIKIDEYGERLTVKTEKLGRIMSKDFLPGEDEAAAEEEETPKDQKNAPVIPIEELTKVFYFQWRVDMLEQGNKTPKIYVGIARREFGLKVNLSTTRDVFCIYLSTGDIFGKRKWKDYYSIEPNKQPKYGHFVEGSVIGMLIDRDRGIINFFKDGNDLGQAFVDPMIKTGEFFPFIQTGCKCEISIFHPFVYPAYRAPVPYDPEAEEALEGEEEQE